MALDPTNGALIITPDFDLKVRKTVLRKVLKIKLRPKRGEAFLHLQIVCVEDACAALRSGDGILGYLQKLALNGHECLQRIAFRVS